MDEVRQRLIAKVHDESLVEYFFLRKEVGEVVDLIESLTFVRAQGHHDVPFNASVKGYHGATDSQGHQWVIKPVLSDQDALYHRIAEVVYLLDFQMATLSSPTTVITIDGKRFRASKVVPGAVNISSYDYLQQPFKNILVGDLVNRWLHFDEDRNPNNYMVIQNSKKTPLIVAIDFDKSDLESEVMKIQGTDDKFGWIRHEKNRYLTLFKAEHFDKVPISVFEDRLTLMMNINLDQLETVIVRLLTGFCADPAAKAAQIKRNIAARRAYINEYFRKWFKPADETALAQENQDYSAFGSTFMKIYQGKK